MWNLAGLAQFSRPFKLIYSYHETMMKEKRVTYLRANSIENHITTIISITNKRAIACSSYSWIVEKTLKAKHVNTIKKLKSRKENWIVNWISIWNLIQKNVFPNLSTTKASPCDSTCNSSSCGETLHENLSICSNLNLYPFLYLRKYLSDVNETANLFI